MITDELNDQTQQYEQNEAVEQPQPEQAAVPSEKEQNMRYLRERAEAADRRVAELERMVQMNMNQNQPSAKLKIEDEEEDFDLSDDTYIEGKHLKKYVRSLKKQVKEANERQERFMRDSTVTNAELRLKSQFPDFDSVVCKANLERLSAQKPSLFRSIMSNPDIYDQGYTAYEMIKGAGLAQNNYESQDRRLEENKAKPRSIANIPTHAGDTPLSRVGDFDRRILTKERKDQILKNLELAKSFRT